MRYYLDTEFDGHGGPLLSLALVREDGFSIHLRTGIRAMDLWVIRNVEPLMDEHDADLFGTLERPNDVGAKIRWFLHTDTHPVIVADAPGDIARFCVAIGTGADGEWTATEYPQITFEYHNVEPYPTTLPGAVQHNAWWDAMALREKLALPTSAAPDDGAERVHERTASTEHPSPPSREVTEHGGER